MFHASSRARPAMWAALLSLVLVGLGSAPLPAAEEWGPGTRMMQAVGRVMVTVRTLTDNSKTDINKFGYDDDLCILAAFLPAGESVAFNKELAGGRDYLILGGGDDFMKDMDIEVRDSNGK